MNAHVRLGGLLLVLLPALALAADPPSSRDRQNGDLEAELLAQIKLQETECRRCLDAEEYAIGGLWRRVATGCTAVLAAAAYVASLSRYRFHIRDRHPDIFSRDIVATEFVDIGAEGLQQCLCFVPHRIADDHGFAAAER